MAAAAVLALTGCSQSGGTASVAERVERGIPQEWAGPEPDLVTGEPVVGRLGPGELGVVTFGSSSCPSVATSFEANGSAELEIVFEPSGFETCTADMAATTHVFELPEGADRGPSTVTLVFGAETLVVTLDLR